MPEFLYRERPIYSPTHCFLCRAADVPVVEIQVNEVQVWTNDGVRDVQGVINLCVGNDRDGVLSGCLPQMARLLGMVDKTTYEVNRQALAETREELAAAWARNEELEEARPKVVELSSLQAYLNQGQATSTAAVGETTMTLELPPRPGKKGK